MYVCSQGSVTSFLVGQQSSQCPLRSNEGESDPETHTVQVLCLSLGNGGIHIVSKYLFIHLLL